MLLESFKVSGSAILQIILLGALGYFLVKKDVLGKDGLSILSRLSIDVTLPALIFYQLINDFSFDLYPHWWLFPLASFAITLIGLAVGALFVGFIKGQQNKLQFLSLIAFQNSGFLPLALITSLLPFDKAEPMFVYLFLFLLGFNILLFSLGVYMLAFSKGKKFEFASLFSAPVVATLLSLLFVVLGLNRFMPQAVLRPAKILGDCTVPLALLVVGGNLAQIRLHQINKKAMSLVILAKLIILPALGILFLMKFRIPELIGLLILIELAVPPATTSSVIVSHYKREDLLISQGIFFGHLASIVTLPLFLSIYFMLGLMP